MKRQSITFVRSLGKFSLGALLLAALNWGAGPAVLAIPATSDSATTVPTTRSTTGPATKPAKTLRVLEGELKKAKRELANVERGRQKKLEMDKGYYEAKAEVQTATLEKERAKSGTRQDRTNAAEALKRAQMNLERVTKEFMDSPDPDVEAQKAVVADIQAQIDAIHSEAERAREKQAATTRP